MRSRLSRAIAVAALCTAVAAGQDLASAQQATTLSPHRVDAAQGESPPAEAFRVMPPPAEGPQITPYLLYQTTLAWNQDELRRERWSRVKTEADLLELRAELRKSLLQMIGGLPTAKSDLHATITGVVTGAGFHIDKLVYQSLPGFYVTALVYVPGNGERLHPAVLVPAGHSPDGKAHYQELCQRLVLRGYLVISWDPVGQGERIEPVRKPYDR